MCVCVLIVCLHVQVSLCKHAGYVTLSNVCIQGVCMVPKRRHLFTLTHAHTLTHTRTLTMHTQTEGYRYRHNHKEILAHSDTYVMVTVVMLESHSDGVTSKATDVVDINTYK
jgi:hypothetical protein